MSTHLSISQYKHRVAVSRAILTVGIIWTLLASFDAALGHFVSTGVGLTIIATGLAIKWHAREHLDYHFRDE